MGAKVGVSRMTLVYEPQCNRVLDRDRQVDFTGEDFTREGSKI